MTFIIHHPDGTREQYSNHYDEGIESERDAAFDDAYMTFPDCYKYHLLLRLTDRVVSLLHLKSCHSLIHRSQNLPYFLPDRCL